MRVESLTVPVPRTAQGDGASRLTTRPDPFARLDRIDWPPPSRVRTADGRPGPEYWQQHADYDIAATLDTARHTIRAHMSLTYTNNSPDTLHYVWMQLDQNLYKAGSAGTYLFPEDTRFGDRGFEGGYEIHNLVTNGKHATPEVHDTQMRVELAEPLVPHGGKVTIAMDYAFAVPEHGSDRMARDGPLYEIAQWYPRIDVYDDLRGWNTDQYLGQGEFYLEYGDINFEVTVPAGYVVAGSGVLQNPQDVLSAAQRARLATAAHSDTVIRIITEAESKPVVTSGTKTWRFRAQHVRDVAWAGAPDFRWDATSWKGILAQAYYEWPKAGAEWTRGAEETQWTIRTYSQFVFPFPYPQATSVAGPVGGMEYPMIVFVNYATQESDPNGVFGTLDHEHGHEWFPMIVGSNERRYAWMDEGFNTYINTFSNELRFPGHYLWPEYMDNWRNSVANGEQRPLMTPPDRVPPAALGAIGYRKPGAVLLALRNHVVGRLAFDQAFRDYTASWAFKHPTPADFFRSIESSTGEDLAWFWRGFFYSNDVLDIGIDSASTISSDGKSIAIIQLRKHTSIPFPVEMRLKLADGTTQDVHLPVDIWFLGDQYMATIPVRSPLAGARLWPDGTVPDFNSSNDTWGNAPPQDKLGPVTTGGLVTSLSTQP
ncbi:MAG: M1 family metallopeptidase [Gemmatimonadaceae bacterium]|nr:M1 family metallopeptidase [Gemmatimonadaceae bacterium]